MSARVLPWWKILVTSTRKIVLKHHLILSMSRGDLNWIPVVETVTNLQPLKNVPKRSWLTDYSNLWDSGLSRRSLALNGRCNNRETLERSHLYCVHCVYGRYQHLLHACARCTTACENPEAEYTSISKCSVVCKADVEELRWVSDWDWATSKEANMLIAKIFLQLYEKKALTIEFRKGWFVSGSIDLQNLKRCEQIPFIVAYCTQVGLFQASVT